MCLLPHPQTSCSPPGRLGSSGGSHRGSRIDLVTLELCGQHPDQPHALRLIDDRYHSGGNVIALALNNTTPTACMTAPGLIGPLLDRICGSRPQLVFLVAPEDWTKAAGSSGNSTACSLQIVISRGSRPKASQSRQSCSHKGLKRSSKAPVHLQASPFDTHAPRCQMLVVWESNSNSSAVHRRGVGGPA
jgi:hypothetical protein